MRIKYQFVFSIRSGVKTEAIDAFCWIHATFPLDPSLIEKLSKLSPGPPHINRLCSTNQSPPPDTSYYQWVHVFLIVQAVIFLVPTHLWTNMEGRRVSSLCLDEVKDNYYEIDKWRISVEAFVITLKQNNWYFTKFLICEALQLCILLGVIYLTDIFLYGMFYTLGLNTINYYLTPPDIRRNMISPACQVFPTVTSCQFPTGSLTGTVNIDHALCVLSLNIINDKIFLIEWGWFLFLLVIAIISTLCRILSLAIPWLRVAMLKSTDISFSMEDDKLIKRVVERCRLGDWFLLTMVKKNLNDRQFTSWIKEVDERINETTKKERVRIREGRNGHGSHTSYWGRAAQGMRERKCYTLDSNESRSEKEDVSENCA